MDSKDTITIHGFNHVPFEGRTYSENEMLQRSKAFYEEMNKRRSVRTFSNQEVPVSVIENIIKTAATAPSGAHKQPWTFCVVSQVEIKKEIRKAAEKEEYESYTHRMSESWKEDLKPMATDWNKPFLENAPYLIVIFKKAFDYDEEGQKVQNYYVNESVGIAAGMLITAIHQAGLVTLTHTPSPMNFLQKILDRPDNERPYLLLPVGYPDKKAKVPDLKRKTLEEIAVFYAK